MRPAPSRPAAAAVTATSQPQRYLTNDEAADYLRLSPPEFDSSKAHFRPTPSNGAGFRAMGRQKPRYTGC